MKTSILVCTHKEAYVPNFDYFLPIHVGKSLSSKELDVQGDDTGDNISEKNRNYCELTALYWAWKNLPNTDIIGLNHYRRYFDFRNAFFVGDKRIIKDAEFRKIAKEESIQSFLSEYDIILPKRMIYPYSLTMEYRSYHIVNDLDILRQTISDLYPEYIDSFNEIMDNNNKMSPYNMFITRWEVFNDYSQWLFNILFEVEKRICISKYPDQARVFGYMGERLLNVYCRQKGLKIKYLPIQLVEDNIKDPKKINYYFNKIRFQVCFNLLKYSNAK